MKARTIFMSLLTCTLILFAHFGDGHAAPQVARPRTEITAPSALATSMASIVASSMTAVPVEREFIRNGDFDSFSGRRDIHGWQTNSLRVAVEPDIGRDGGPGVELAPEKEGAAYMFQEIYLPTAILSGTLSFDFRVRQLFDTPGFDTIINGAVAIVPLNGETPDLDNIILGGQLLESPTNDETQWFTFSAPLSAENLADLNQARANKQRLALYFMAQSGTLTDLLGLGLSIDLDNVSLQIQGTWDQPSFDGAIVYIDGASIKRIDPNGGAPQTLWTHTEADPEILSVRWKPDATEIAFTSDHETYYSRTLTDLYGMQADGGKLRRITNAPAHADIVAGSHPKGSVRLNILNNYSDAADPVSTFTVYVQGADKLHSFNLPAYTESAELLVENVAQLETTQYIVFFYSSAKCSGNRRDMPGFVDIAPGQTVELDLTFSATNCGGVQPKAFDVSWKRDGSEIGFTLTGAPYRTPATGTSGPGQSWFNLGGSMGASDWSPVDDRVLFGFSTAGIGLRASPEASESSIVVQSQLGGFPDNPAWLPDGARFLFIESGDLFSASAQGQIQAVERHTFFNLNGERVEWARPSPDGKFVVIERRLGEQSTLWILEMENLANSWPLAAGQNPDWSRVAPTVPSDPDPEPDPDPNHDPNPDPNPDPDPSPDPDPNPDPDPDPSPNPEGVMRLFIPAALR